MKHSATVCVCIVTIPGRAWRKYTSRFQNDVSVQDANILQEPLPDTYLWTKGCVEDHLEFVCLDVLPQSVDDDRSGLRVHAEQSGQPRIQLELQRLVVQE